MDGRGPPCHCMEFTFPLSEVGYERGHLLGHFISVLFFFFKISFIHSSHRERQRHRQREKQAPRGEPIVGFNPRTPGSCSEPKADAQSLNQPGNTISSLF